MIGVLGDYGFLKLQFRRTGPYDKGHREKTSTLLETTYSMHTTHFVSDARFLENVLQPCGKVLQLVLQRFYQ